MSNNYLKQDRNNNLIYDYLSGKSRKELANKYEISYCRVSDIIVRYAKRLSTGKME